jgi:hypothetical protein
MKRKILIGLLALGTVGGYASGFASMRCKARHGRAAFEERVAETCVRAAKKVERDEQAGRDR